MNFYTIYIPLLTFLDISIGFTFNIVNMLNYYIMCNGAKVVLNKHIESIKNQNLSVIFRKQESTSLVNLSAHYESDKYFKQIFRTLNKLT